MSSTSSAGTPFAKAVVDYTSIASVEAALESGLLPDVNYGSGYGKNPLHIVSQRGAVEVCEYLISKGADVHTRTCEEETALHIAASAGKLDVCTCLLAHGAEVIARDVAKSTPLWSAAIRGHFAVCDLLLAHGADVNAPELSYRTALSAACSMGQIAASEWLVSRGADVDGGDREHVDVNAHERSLPPLACAVTSGYVAMCSWLEEHGADVGAVMRHYGQRLVAHAAAASDVDVLEWLLARGGSANAKNDSGHYVLVTAAAEVDDAVCQVLLAFGSDANATREYYDGATALQAAAVRGSNTICAMLLDEGANVTTERRNGDTALLFAAKYARHAVAKHRHISVCQLLVAHCAPIPAAPLLPELHACFRGYLAAIRDAGWRRRLPAFAAYVAAHGRWWTKLMLH